jgi:signal transduction histidine kinase/CheY-like chemotaxis protein
MKQIKLKLLIPTLLMVALAIAGTTYVSLMQYQAFLNQEKETTQKHVSRLISFLQARRQHNIELINLLSHKKRFIADAILRDRNALLNEMSPFVDKMEYGFVNLYDLQGKVIARADIPDKFGKTDELSQLALKVSRTKDTVSSVSMYNGLLAVFTVKTIMGPLSPVAVLVAGNYLDQPAVDNIAQSNNLDIKIYLNDDEIVSSSKYIGVASPGSERTSLIDISDLSDGQAVLKAFLTEDVSELKKDFWSNLIKVTFLLLTVSALIIWFSRRTILSAADSLNNARLSAEQNTVVLKSVNEHLNSEIAERRQAEAALKRRDRILEALSFMASRFLQTSDIDSNINICLERLGAATEVSRIAIRENYTDAFGSLSAKRKYDWTAPGGAHHKYREMSYLVDGIDSESLSGKRAVYGLVRNFNVALRAYYEKGNVKSVLMVPIFVNSSWWGYMGFCECESEREWDAAEVGVLGTAADIIGAALYRRQVDEELVLARDHAMEASNAKSLFLANMSHEIRTPMNSIIGFAEILEKTATNNTQKEYLNIIRNSADTLLDIINSILDFSKIESGKFELEKADFDLMREIEGMIETLSFRANEKNVDLILMLDPTLPRFLVGDSLRIKQVLINLIGNAIKFTDRGGYVYTRIMREAVDDSTGAVYILFSVADNGIGIPEDKQGAILEPFTQADCSITREYGGTGLGLAISDNIVSMMGGRLSFESEHGKGTTFLFTLKLNVSDVEEIDSSKLDLKVALCRTTRNGPSHDGVIRDYLEHLGATVYMLDEISDLMDIDELDVLIMMIPLTDSDAIRSARFLTSAPIIAVAREYAAEIMEGSFDKVIYQPVYMTKLIAAISEVSGTEMNVMHRRATDKNSEVVQFNARVLVAEDVPTNQMLIKLILGESGIEVDIASNGLEAVEKYRTGTYDVVFMDIHMPVCNGSNATIMIREYEQSKMKRRTPIIALTADAIKGEKEYLLAGGMDDYITKPIDREALTAVLRKHLPGESSCYSPEKSAKTENIGYDILSMAKKLGITDKMARLCLSDFFSLLDVDLAEFRTNVTAGSQPGICEITHKIKGTAANLRIDTIAELCREAETIAKGDLTALDMKGLNEIIDSIDLFRKSLQDRLGLI